jgi:hypothetical protein
MNKRGIELTINFLVLLILSIVVFGLGVKFIYDMVAKSQDLIPLVDQQIHDELRRLVAGNKRVAIAFDRAQVKRGGSTGFGLGILNVNPTKEIFALKAQCEKYGPVGSTELNQPCPAGIVVGYDRSQLSIKNNEYYDTMIVVKANKEAHPGNYVIYVDVCSWEVYSTGVTCPGAGDMSRYDTVQKIFVTVP